MSSLNFILPAKSAGSASDLEAPAFPHAADKSSEPFDKLMNRALAKPARDPGEKSVAAKKPAGNPSPVRKQKPSTTAESSDKSASPADNSLRDTLAAKPKVDSSSQEDTSSTSTDSGKESSNQTNAGPTDPENTAAQQALAASMVAEPTPVVALDVAKTAATGAETNPVGAVGTETGSAPSATTEIASASVENPAVPDLNNLKPGAKEPAADGKKLSGAGTGPAKTAGPDGGAVPIQDLLDQAEAVDETPANTVNSAPAKVHNLTLYASGTSGAEHLATMKNADQAKTAGAPEQSLPGVTLVAATVQEAFRPRPTAKAAARAESSDALAPAGSAAVDRQPSPVETAPGNLISASSQTELRTRALDRTHDMLALHGLQMKQTSTDSLHVVIKPGAGLQLSLQMKQTSDGIEAQAILQQGSFQDLNQHWAELQQRLEERGIRLAPLGQDSTLTNSGQENFQRQYRQPGHSDSLSAGAFAEFASASANVAKPLPTAASSARGWESWA